LQEEAVCKIHVLALEFGGVLVALGLLGQPAFAQQPPTGTMTTGGLGHPCNLLHDLVPTSDADPTPVKPLTVVPFLAQQLDPKQKFVIDPKLRDKVLTSGLPCQETISAGGDNSKTPIQNRQRGFDLYSWLTFVALNSPADNPKGIATSQPDTPTVWEDKSNFMQLLDVMLPNDVKPVWGQKVIPPACQARYQANTSLMVVKMIEESFNQPFKTGPLIDQRNNYAIFDILMNKAMFKYIVDNDLYHQAGQKSEQNSTLRIDFPAGHNNKGGDPESIMIKVSWKILTAEDDKRKFHHVQALVAMPRSPDEQSDPPCLEKTLGLVGFHVVHKTVDRPQWIWTSFEHVDNVPELQDIEDHKRDPVAKPLKSYNFFDRSCTDDCPINETPPRPWDPEPANQLQFRRSSDGKILFNSQIVRVVPLTDATRDINHRFQDILDNTIWKNYMLIGTQWPSAFPCTADHSALPAGILEPRTDFDKQPDMNCAPAPTFLANSMLETYSQGEIPQASSSCMACHGNATSYLRRPKDLPNDITEEKDRKTMALRSQSDFTFMLEKAR
jgi:hypothetical protein